MPCGVIGNTSHFDLEESRFEPWRGNKKTFKKIIMKLGLFFVILCCYTESTTGYKYDVKNLKDTTQTGVLYSKAKFTKGDTVRL